MKVADFDLILFPFKSKDNKFIKIDNRYETKLNCNVNSKTIFATPKKTTQTFFHIKIDKNKVEIIGKAAEIYDFVTPVDFMLPIRPETEEACKKLDKLLKSDNMETIDTYVLEFKKKYIKNKEPFPTYPVPQSQFVGFTSKKYLEREGEENIIKKTRNKTLVVKYKEIAPVKFEGRKEEGDAQIRQFIENIFKKHSGLRMEYIKKQFIEHNERNGLSLSLDNLKIELPKFAYYIISGPWGKTWFKYGVDPKTEPEMYLYQTIYENNRKKPFQIFESADLVEVLKKEEDLSFRKVSDPKHGFLTPYGISKCRLFLKESFDKIKEFELFD